MAKLVNGPISANDLMSRLAQAKKVMNKVDSGNYTTGHYDESDLISEDVDIPQHVMPMENYNTEPVVNIKPLGTPSIERIQNSNLPEVIKRAMIEKPIEQPSLNGISLSETLDMNFVNGVKRLMNEDGVGSKPKSHQTQQTKRPSPTNNNVNNAPNYNISENNLVATLTPIIENIIRRTLDDIVDKKLSQILSAHQTASINENLVLKVGDSIFKGKITGVNKVRK